MPWDPLFQDSSQKASEPIYTIKGTTVRKLSMDGQILGTYEISESIGDIYDNSSKVEAKPASNGVIVGISTEDYSRIISLDNELNYQWDYKRNNDKHHPMVRLDEKGYIYVDWKGGNLMKIDSDGNKVDEVTVAYGGNDLTVAPRKAESALYAFTGSKHQYDKSTAVSKVDLDSFEQVEKNVIEYGEGTSGASGLYSPKGVIWADGGLMLDALDLSKIKEYYNHVSILDVDPEGRCWGVIIDPNYQYYLDYGDKVLMDPNKSDLDDMSNLNNLISSNLNFRSQGNLFYSENNSLKTIGGAKITEADDFAIPGDRPGVYPDNWGVDYPDLKEGDSISVQKGGAYSLPDGEKVLEFEVKGTKGKGEGSGTGDGGDSGLASGEVVLDSSVNYIEIEFPSGESKKETQYIDGDETLIYNISGGSGARINKDNGDIIIESGGGGGAGYSTSEPYSTYECEGVNGGDGGGVSGGKGGEADDGPSHTGCNAEDGDDGGTYTDIGADSFNQLNESTYNGSDKKVYIKVKDVN